MWVSEGHKLEETPVSDEELDAPLRAAHHPPKQMKYRAHLQVRHVPCSAGESVLHARLQTLPGMVPSGRGCFWIPNPYAKVG